MKLYRVETKGRYKSRGDLFVLAENETEASEAALKEVKKRGYNMIADYVSEIVLIADTEDTASLLVLKEATRSSFKHSWQCSK